MEEDGHPKVIPPSGRVPGQHLVAAPILKRRRRRNREENMRNRSILGVSSAREIYRRKGGTRDPGGSLARLPLAAPPGRLEPWWWLSGPTLVFEEASGALIFCIIFPEFFGHF